MSKLFDSTLNKYAVGMFMWRRSSHIHIILKAIISYGPTKLYLFFDGPRNSAEQIEINEVKNICKTTLKDVTFDVIIDAAPIHYGLNKRFSSGLHSLFTAEPAAIILEDDTIPSDSFFSFCSFYLNAFNNRNDILAINGFLKARKEFLVKNDVDRPFTNHIFNPWGWASWSHKFLPLYNPEIKSVSLIDKLRVFTLWWNFDLFQLRKRLLQDVATNKLHTWDVQLQWSIFIASKKVLTPPVNLVINVGNDSLASTFVAGRSDFEQELSEIDNCSFTSDVIHLPSYDVELCRSKTNKQYFIKKIRKIKDSLLPGLLLISSPFFAGWLN